MWSLRATSCAGKLALSAWFVGGLCLSLFAIFDPNPARAYSEEQQAALKASHGRAALIRGQYRDADRLFTGALQSAALPFATRISTLSNRGIARWRLHHLRAALDDFNAALKFAPEEATLYNNRGNVLMALNLHEEPPRTSARPSRSHPLMAPPITTAAMRGFFLANTQRPSPILPRRSPCCRATRRHSTGAAKPNSP